MNDFVTAHRNGQTREFTRRVWDMMGEGHCGWELIPQVPKEVAAVVAQRSESGQKPSKKRRK